MAVEQQFKMKSDRQQYSMPKYDLNQMFNDQRSIGYKVDSKYDFFFDTEDYSNDSMGYRISTRSPQQCSLVTAFKTPQYVEQDFNEIRREHIWKLLSKNLFENSQSPAEFMKSKFRQKYCDALPTNKMQGLPKNQNKVVQKLETQYGLVRTPETINGRQSMPMNYDSTKYSQQHQTKYAKLKFKLNEVSQINGKLKNFTKQFQKNYHKREVEPLTLDEDQVLISPLNQSQVANLIKVREPKPLHVKPLSPDRIRISTTTAVLSQLTCMSPLDQLSNISTSFDRKIMTSVTASNKQKEQNLLNTERQPIKRQNLSHYTKFNSNLRRPLSNSLTPLQFVQSNIQQVENSINTQKDRRTNKQPALEMYRKKLAQKTRILSPKIKFDLHSESSSEPDLIQKQIPCNENRAKTTQTSRVKCLFGTKRVFRTINFN